MFESNFLELVAKERIRQIVDKGYTREHDDEHTNGELADAGAAYGASSEPFIFIDIEIGNLLQKHYGRRMRNLYPFGNAFDSRKNHDKKENLIIGAAFFMAEYDRIIREEQKDSRCRGCESLKGIKPDTWCSDLGVPMDEHSTRCDEYRLPPFEASENNPLFKSFMRSSRE